MNVLDRRLIIVIAEINCFYIHAAAYFRNITSACSKSLFVSGFAFSTFSRWQIVRTWVVHHLIALVQWIMFVSNLYIIFINSVYVLTNWICGVTGSRSLLRIISVNRLKIDADSWMTFVFWLILMLSVRSRSQRGALIRWQVFIESISLLSKFGIQMSIWELSQDYITLL